MEFWQLPGPAAFVQSIADAIMDGRNVVIACSLVDEAIIARMIDESDGWGLAVHHCEVTGQLPIDIVFESLSIDERIPSKRTIAALIARMQLRCRVVVSAIAPDRLDDWMAFASEYESACRAVSKFDRTQFIFLVTGAAKSALPVTAPALEVLVWDGWIGEADVLGYIAWRWRRKRLKIDATAKLCARVIARLAMWDFDLVDQFMALPITDILSDGARLAAIRHENAGNLPRTWEGGGVGRFDGEDFVHSLVLAAEGDPMGELSMRLWAAQSTELLPLLELQRRKLVNRMKGLPGLPARIELDGKVITDLDDEEIGVLSRVADAHRFPHPIRDEAQRLRRLRNRLAHFQPVSIDEALVVLEDRR